MLRRRLAPILLFAVFAALFVLPSFYVLITDWWWFREIGYEIVFTRELTTRLLLFLAPAFRHHIPWVGNTNFAAMGPWRTSPDRSR